MYEPSYFSAFGSETLCNVYHYYYYYYCALKHSLLSFGSCPRFRTLRFNLYCIFHITAAHFYIPKEFVRLRLSFNVMIK